MKFKNSQKLNHSTLFVLPGGQDGVISLSGGCEDDIEVVEKGLE